MGKQEVKYCIKCVGYTNHNWMVDPDSDPEEPQFSQICLKCEGVDDYIEDKLEPNQTPLFPLEIQND